MEQGWNKHTTAQRPCMVVVPAAHHHSPHGTCGRPPAPRHPCSPACEPLPSASPGPVPKNKAFSLRRWAHVSLLSFSIVNTTPNGLVVDLAFGE